MGPFHRATPYGSIPYGHFVPMRVMRIMRARRSRLLGGTSPCMARFHRHILRRAIAVAPAPALAISPPFRVSRTSSTRLCRRKKTIEFSARSSRSNSLATNARPTEFLLKKPLWLQQVQHFAPRMGPTILRSSLFPCGPRLPDPPRTCRLPFFPCAAPVSLPF